MKFRLVFGTVALSACLLVPSVFAQPQDQQPGSTPDATAKDKSSTNPTAQQTKDPSATPTIPADPGAKKEDASSAGDKAKDVPPPVVQQPDDSKVKHDGSKKDVNAIGNRKVGGRGLGDWYSLEGEIRMGKQYAQEVEATSKLIRDPVVTEYVNRIGQNLVRNSDAQVPFTIKVIDSDEVNAFALPGGFFFVNSGLILAADTEAEMAGVMSHEIALVAARHGTRNASKAELANWLSLRFIFLGGPAGFGARSAVGLLLPMKFLQFSRSAETEADYLGLQYMYKTGYDPQAFVDF